MLAWDRQCPSCGDLVPLDSPACDRCGHPLARSSTEMRVVRYRRGWRHIVRLLVALTVVLTAAVYSAFSCGSFDASALIPGGVIALAWIPSFRSRSSHPSGSQARGDMADGASRLLDARHSARLVPRVVDLLRRLTARGSGPAARPSPGEKARASRASLSRGDGDRTRDLRLERPAS